MKPTRKGTPAKPSFMSSLPKKSLIADVPSSTKESKRTPPSGRRGRWKNPISLSAGMPGNEDVDPPVRRSTSAAAERLRERLRS